MDDWQDLTDPLNPIGVGWVNWICENCGEDGDPIELVDGTCWNCGEPVEPN